MTGPQPETSHRQRRSFAVGCSFGPAFDGLGVVVWPPDKLGGASPRSLIIEFVRQLVRRGSCRWLGPVVPE